MVDGTNLTLPVNTYWGGLIESGKIDWDYREVKPYWVSRICSCASGTTDVRTIAGTIRNFKTATFTNRHNGHKSVYEIRGIEVVDGTFYDFFRNGVFYFIIGIGRKIR